MPWVGFAAGLVLWALTASSVIGTLVVPRRVNARLARVVGILTRVSFRIVALASRRYETRDRIFAILGPSLLIVLLGVWIAFLVVAFGLMLWPFMSSGSLIDGLTVSASSFFTLGFAHNSGDNAPLTAIAAFTGLIVIALQIAYLPVLYGGFNRREQLVTMLEARGGAPAWGPEILARHELIDNVESLGHLYERWEEWAADVAESHTSYPALLWFRSPAPERSWIIGLLAVTDAAAMHLSTRPLSAPAQARPFLRMSIVALRELALVLRLPVNEDPRPDDPVQLTREDFDEAVHHLEHSGWRLEREPDEAWTHFRGWRVNYETLAWSIAEAIDAPPALWSGSRRHLPATHLPPARPAHREPSVEQIRVKQETRQRRRARGAPVEETHDHSH